MHAFNTVGPRVKIDSLEAGQFRALQLPCGAFVLKGLFARAYDQRAIWPGEEIAMFARSVQSIEDDLKPVGGRDANDG
ncbi:MAG: hypothetical protein NVS9B15_07810 [Acidobacteriaceae bacterium]